MSKYQKIYLIKHIPKGLNIFRRKEIVSVYITKELGNLKIKIKKIRFFCKYCGYECEIDVLNNYFKGVMIATLHFKNEYEKKLFIMPWPCAVEISNQLFYLFQKQKKLKAMLGVSIYY